MKRNIIIGAVIVAVAAPAIAIARQGADDPVDTTPVATSNTSQVQKEHRDNRKDEDTLLDRQHDMHDDSRNRAAAPQQPAAAPVTAPAESNTTGTVSFAEARNIAQRELPGGQIVKFEHEFEHGQKVYSFRFRDDSRVDVNFAGQVTRVENEAFDD